MSLGRLGAQLSSNLAVFVASIALAACAVQQQPQPSQSAGVSSIETKTPAAALVGQWSLRLTISGGFAGESQWLQIESDGGFAAVDSRQGLEINGVLDPDDLRLVTSLLTTAIDAFTIDRQSQCADCFVYSLSLQTGGKPVQAAVNDASLPGSPLEPLIRELIRIKDVALAGP